ncbi:MAG: hypothetical protein MUC43_13500 [Pirellula sp.]|nr:hypothetical protein [Pirellula sp.]
MTFRSEYLRALVPLAILFAIYSLTFSRWIDSAPKNLAKRWETPPLKVTSTWWEPFFKEDSWQRNGPQSLETESGILLYKDRIEISERRWKIKPLTILIPQGSDGNGKSRRAVFIENPEGAEIQFESRPEWNAPHPPLETGLLLGKTLIYAPPETPSSGDGLQIETSEIRIENRKIWTDKPISMRMGDSVIDGRHLTILLAQKLLSQDTTKKEKRPFEGLESMELFYVDQVHVGLKPGGLWPNKETKNAPLRPAHAILKCGGRFEFKFHQREAVLYGGVRMEHIVQGAPIDTFDCEELHLRVGLHSATNNPTNTPTNNPTNTSTDPNKSNASPWTIEELTAYGAVGRDHTDYSKWLKLNAPGMQAQAMGLTLFMDFLNGQVALSNTLPLTMPKDSSRVYLRREGLQIWCPEVQYHNPQIVAAQLANDEPSAGPNRLGGVSARGPGTAQLETRNEPWTISWGTKLLVRPDGDKDVVTLDGSANISNRTEGHFSADHLDFWLHPVDATLRKQLEPFYENGKVPQWLADRMVANRNVVIQSPTLQAKVDSMQVAFIYPTSESKPVEQNVAPASFQSASPDATPLANQTSPPGGVEFAAPTLGNIASQPVRQPSRPAANNATPYFGTTNKTQTPFVVLSKSLEAVIRNTGGESAIHAMTVQGNFTVQRQQLSDSAPWLFEARGEQFRLQRSPSDLANVHLVGAPASIALGSGWIVAPEFSFSQTEHAFWIDHPGELVLPQEAVPLGGFTGPVSSLVSTSGMDATRAPNGFPSLPTLAPTNTMKWLEAPRLKWGERMVFDGKKAMFGGNISLHCKIESSPNIQWHIALHSGTMGIDMVNPIPLDAKETKGLPKAEIATIRFENNVDINAFQTDRDLNRISREHMKLPRLDVYVPGQTMKGYGPGELWTRRFGGLNPLANITPSQSPTPSGSEGSLQCMHLSFLRGLEGDYRTKTISFSDRVEALLGPIASWEQEVNVQYADTLAKNQTHLIADRVDLFDSSDLSWNRNNPQRKQSSSWEVKAVQRVTVRSQTDKGLFAASGDELKYDSGSDVLRISGAPQNASILLPNANNPNSPSELKVGTFAIQLKTGNFESTLGSFEGQIPNNMQRAGTVPLGSQSNPPSSGPILPSPRNFPNRQ